MKLKSLLSLAVSAAAVSAQAQVITVTVDTTFGTDGQLNNSDAGITFLDSADSLARGLAFNPATGNLLVASRTGGNALRVISPTGTVLGSANLTGVTGGSGAVINMPAVTSDGRIYLNNLSANVSISPYKVYTWATEADIIGNTASTVAYTGSARGTASRLGDTFDANGTTLFAGYGSANPGTGVGAFSGGATLAYTDVAETGGTNGTFRLGLAARDNTSFYGTTSGVFRYFTTAGGTGTNSTITNAPGVAGSERLMDYRVFNGVAFLATVDTGNNRVRVYRETSAGVLDFRTSFTPTFTANSNGNGVGSLAWGAFNASTSTAELYAMNTNNGIIKYTVSGVPEPASMAVLGLGLAAMKRRRRSSK